MQTPIALCFITVRGLIGKQDASSHRKSKIGTDLAKTKANEPGLALAAHEIPL
jgi:hypothetical protein